MTTHLNISFIIGSILLFITIENILSVSASGSVVLTDDNFDEITKATLKDGKPWFIEFYAPWCGHCKRLQPIWEYIADENEDLNIAKLDATQNRLSSERFGIRGFPTLILISGGKEYKYEGKRDSDSLVAFARGDYLKLDASKVKDITKPVSKLDSFTGMIQKDFNKAWKFQKGLLGIVFGAGIGVGVFIGLLFGCIFGGCAVKHEPKRKRKKNE